MWRHDLQVYQHEAVLWSDAQDTVGLSYQGLDIYKPINAQNLVFPHIMVYLKKNLRRTYQDTKSLQKGQELLLHEVQY